MQTVTIDIPVTAKHIAEGRCRNRWRCPVALAIQERTNLFADVGAFRIKLSYNLSYDSSFKAGFAPSARLWIEAFDFFGHAEPFTFPLTLPVVEVG